MSIFDWLIVAVFLGALITIGYLFSHKNKNIEDYFVAGRSMPGWIVAIAAAGTTITAATVQTLLGSVKGASIAMLCNRKTLYTQLLPLQDNGKNALVRFEGTYSSARVYGVDVLVDDNVADSTIFCGDMDKLVAAIGEDINVRQAYDINTNSYKYLGVALFDTKVGIASAFAKLAPAGG